MTTFNNVICIVVIFVAYGIAGRLDYEDAMRSDAIRREQPRTDCLKASEPVIREPIVSINDPAYKRSRRYASKDSPDNGQPRAAVVL